MMTRGGQSLVELANEYIASMRKMPDAGKDMADMATHFTNVENITPDAPSVIASITDMQQSGNNGYRCDFLQRCKPNVSNVFLAAIAWQVGNVMDLFETIVGLYCVAFYSTHPSTEQVTFKWMVEQTRGFKLVDINQTAPWALTAQLPDNGGFCFKKITPEELYTYTESTEQDSTAVLEHLLEQSRETSEEATIA